MGGNHGIPDVHFVCKWFQVTRVVYCFIVLLQEFLHSVFSLGRRESNCLMHS